MTAGGRTRLTEADRAAWAGFARDISPLAGRAGAARRQAAAASTAATAAAASTAATAAAASLPSAATPSTAAAPSEAQRPPPRPTAIRARSDAIVVPLAIGGPPAGVDKATWRRFRTGKLGAVRTLDLHGMTAQRAFHALSGFLRAAHAEHLRCVEIVTGRGATEGTGVLRRELPLWLPRPDIRPLVLGAAHPHAANTGAVRLLLRRVR